MGNWFSSKTKPEKYKPTTEEINGNHGFEGQNFPPLGQNDIEYNMHHKRRGLALIFNHEFFRDETLKQRTGTNIDCQSLTNTFQSLDFLVKSFKDLTYSNIIKEIKRAANVNHSKNDCLVICILSHGENDFIFAHDTRYKLSSICAHFTDQKCPSLTNKPRLFFIQACQGTSLDPGIKLTLKNIQSDSRLATLKPTQSETKRLEFGAFNHSDFLLAFSTIPGFYSWRNTTKGSWFIQSLCHVLDQFGKRHDFLTLMTVVCRKVALDFESNTPEDPITHEQKQIPCIASMLTRLLKFNNKKNI